MTSKQQKDEVEYTDVSHLSVLKESLQMTSPQFQAVTEDVVCYLSGNIVVLLAQSTLEQRHLYAGVGRTIRAVTTGSIAKQTDVELSSSKLQLADESLVFIASTGMQSAGNMSFNACVDVYGFPSRIKLGSFALPNGIPVNMSCSYDSKKLHVLFSSTTCNVQSLGQFTLFPGTDAASTDINFEQITCNSFTSVKSSDIAMDPKLGVMYSPSSKMVPNHYTTSHAIATLVAAQPVLWVANVAMANSTLSLLQHSVSDNMNVPTVSVNPTYIPYLLKNADGNVLDNICDMVWLKQDTLALITTDGCLYTCGIKNQPIPCTSVSQVLPAYTLATHMSTKNLPKPMFSQNTISTLSKNMFHDAELQVLTPIIQSVQPTIVVKVAIDSVDHPLHKQMYQQTEPKYTAEDRELLQTIETQCPTVLPEKPTRPQTIDYAEQTLHTPAALDAMEEQKVECSNLTTPTTEKEVFSFNHNAFEVTSKTSTLKGVIGNTLDTETRKLLPKRVLSLQVCDKYLLVGAEADTILWYQQSTLSHVFTLVLPVTARTAATLLSGVITPPQAQLQPPALPALPLRDQGVHRSVINMTFSPSFNSLMVLNASGVTFRVVFSGQPKLLLEGERFVRTAFNYWSKLVGINDTVPLNKETETQGAAIVKVLQSLGITLPKYPLFVPASTPSIEEDDEDDDILDTNDSKEDERDVLKLKCEKFIEDAMLNQALCVLLQSLFTVTSLSTFALSLDVLTSVYRTLHVQTLCSPSFKSKGIYLTRPNLASFQKGDLDIYRAQVAAAEAATSNGNIVILASPCGALHLWSIVPRCLVSTFTPKYKTTALTSLDNTIYLGNVYGGIFAIDISDPVLPTLAWSVRIATSPIRGITLDSLGVCLFVTSEDHTGVYVARTGKVVFHTATTAIFPHSKPLVTVKMVEKLLNVNEEDFETDNAGTLSWPTPKMESMSYKNILESPVYSSVEARAPHITFDRIVNSYITKPLPLLTSGVSRFTGAGKAEPYLLREASKANVFGFGDKSNYQVIREKPKQEQLLCSTWLTSMDEGVAVHRLMLTSTQGRVAVFALPSKTAVVVNRTNFEQTKPIYTVLSFAPVAVCPVPTWASALLPATLSQGKNTGVSETGTPSAGCFILIGHADHSIALYEVLPEGKLVHISSIGPFRSPIVAIDFSTHSEPFSPLLLFTVMLGDGTTHLLTLQPNASNEEDIVIGSKSNDSIVFGDPDVYAQTIIRTHSDGMVPLPPTTEAQREARILDTVREQSSMQASVFANYRKEHGDKEYISSNIGGFTTNERTTNKVHIHSKGYVVTHTPGMVRGKGQVQFSNDARILITNSWDGNVVCWDISRFLSSLLVQMKAVLGEEVMQERANISTRAHNTLRGNVVSDFWQEREEREQQSRVVVVPYTEEPGKKHIVDPTLLVCSNPVEEQQVQRETEQYDSSSSASFLPSSASMSQKEMGVHIDTKEATMKQVNAELAKLHISVQTIREKRLALAQEMSILSAGEEDVSSIVKSIMPEEDLCVDKTLISQVLANCETLVSEKQKSIRRKGLGARITLERLQNAWIQSCGNRRVICASSDEAKDGRVQNYLIRKSGDKQSRMRKHAAYLRNVQVSETNWYTDGKETETTLPKNLQYLLLRCPATMPNPLQHAHLSGFLKFDLPKFVSNEDSEDEEQKKPDATVNSSLSGSPAPSPTKKTAVKKREKAKNLGVLETDSGEMNRMLAETAHINAPAVAPLNLLDDDRGAEEGAAIDMLELAHLYKPSEREHINGIHSSSENNTIHQDTALRVEVSHAMKNLPTISGNSDDFTSPPPKMLYDPLSTWSFVQKRLQCFLLYSHSIELKENFNVIVSQLYEYKNTIIDAVTQRNQAISELCHDIDVNPDLQQLNVCEREEFEHKVDGENSEGKQLVLQNERFTNALDDMMGGVIRIHQKKVVTTVPPPTWYDAEDKEMLKELTEAQQTELAEWMELDELAKIKFETTKQESLAEVEEYRKEITALFSSLDHAVENISKTKLHFSKALMQYKTLFLSLYVESMLCISAQEQQVELKDLLDSYQACAQQWHVITTHLQKAVQVCQNATQELSLTGTDVDRKIRRELNAFNVPVDQCMRVFRSRPKPPVLGHAELYSKDLHSKGISTTIPVDSVVHQVIPRDTLNLQNIQQLYSKHPTFLNNVVKLYNIVDTEPATETKDALKGKKQPATKHDALNANNTVRFNPYPVCPSLRGIGSAVVAHALMSTKETFAWLNPPAVEAGPPDAIDAAKEAWACAVHLRELQLKKEAHMQEIEDTSLDLQVSLVKSQASLLNSRLVNNILNQGIERLQYKKLISTTDAYVFVVVDTQRVELNIAGMLNKEYRRILPVSAVRQINHAIQSAHEKYENQLKIANSLRIQARKRWLESNYIGLCIQDTIDITAEIQLLRLTKALQATIVGGVDVNEKENTANKITSQIQLVRDNTGERLLTLKDSLDLVKRDYKTIQKENQTQLQAIAVLQANIVQVRNIQNHKNVSKEHNISVLENANMFEKPKSNMPSILTIRKLNNVVVAQEDEVNELRQQVAQWRNKTFPTFPVALPAPVSIPFLHTHTQTLPKISRGGSRMQARVQSPPKPTNSTIRQPSRANSTRQSQDGIILPPIIRK